MQSGILYHYITGQEAVIEPYFETINGQRTQITSVVVPIRRNGRVIGVAGIDLEFIDIHEIVSHIKPYEEGYSVIFSNSGIIVSHPDVSQIGKNINFSELGLTGFKFNNSNKQTIISNIQNENIIVVIIPFYIGNSDNNWYAMSVVSENAIRISWDK